MRLRVCFEAFERFLCVKKPPKHFNEKKHRPSRARRCFRRFQPVKFEIKVHFFDIFSDLDDDATHVAAGAGLGLVIS